MAVITHSISVTLPPNDSRQVASHYLFEKAGDEIPLHEHTYFHSSWTIRGRTEVYDDAGKVVPVDQWGFAKFKAGRKHAVRALEDMTEVIHINEPGASCP